MSYYKFYILLCLTFLYVGCSKTHSTSSQAPPKDSVNNPDVPNAQVTDVNFWLTKMDKSILFEKQKNSILFSSKNVYGSTISVDSTQSFQTIDGFGFALTGGSAYLINRLPDKEKLNLLKELFTTDSTYIGISYLRISIGASDLSPSVFTYDDVSNNTPDITLSYFDLGADKYDIIPVLREIVSLQPNIKIIATPWTAPPWMKTNGSAIGGSLKPEYYDVYANYFVKYIQAMKSEGINIDAITPQNEPLNAYNNPAMLMSASEELNFIKNYLGPKFVQSNINTKIIIYDHNLDHIEYPLNILADANANKYIDGSAFHLYTGDIRGMTTVHNAYPEKNVYFTEQWVGGPGNFSEDLSWHVKNLIIGTTKNWSKNVIEWNLASDPNYNPHTTGGCTTCMGAVTIGTSVIRNVSYYIIAHASKFVPQASKRIYSSDISDILNVAFLTPAGKKVMILLNENSTAVNFNLKFKNNYAPISIEPKSLVTLIW